MKKQIIILVALLALLATGCSNPGEKVRASIKICEKNDGLAYLKVNHTAVCNNGAEFTNPLKSLQSEEN